MASRLRRRLCREPRVLTEEQREAQPKSRKQGSGRKAAKPKSQQTSATCRKTAKQTESKTVANF